MAKWETGNLKTNGRTHERGFTLLEMLLVLGMGTAMLTSVVTAIFQTVSIPPASSMKISALENVQSAAYWVSKDVRMADDDIINLVDGGPAQNSLSLNWKTYYDVNGQFTPLSPVSHSSAFALSGTDLQRTYDGNTTIVARNIASAQFSRSGGIITATITAYPRGRAEAAERMTYQMYLQPKVDPIQ